MRRKRTVGYLVAIGIGASLVFLFVRAFQPPVDLSKLELLKRGMTAEEVTEILGQPSRIIPGGRQYSVRGTNYCTSPQWVYQSPLKFGYVNVGMTTNKTFGGADYEEF